MKCRYENNLSCSQLVLVGKIKTWWQKIVKTQVFFKKCSWHFYLT